MTSFPSLQESSTKMELHPNPAAMLNTLGNSLGRRFDQIGSMDDINCAVEVAEMAVEATPQDHPDRAAILNNLGNRLINRHKVNDKERDRDKALKCYIQSTKCYSAIPLRRISSARRAIQLLLEQNHWQKASSLACDAVKLLPLACSRYLSREGKQHVVSQTSGLAAEACSLSLRTQNDPCRALEYLEHGCGLILGYLMDSRGDISELKKGFPRRAEEFDGLRLKAFTSIRSDNFPKLRYLLREREEAARDLERCVEEIRRLPGHERFLLPPSSDVPKAHAKDGPIVVVNITNISSDAIIVLPSDIKAVKLPELHGPDIDKDRPWSLTRSATRDAEILGKPSDGNGKRFCHFLKWLWSHCVRLVLDELDFCKIRENQELPRIWWMGTGLPYQLRKFGHLA